MKTIDHLIANHRNAYAHLTEAEQDFARNADVWAELTMCRQGVNAFGSYTAEIYAYRVDDALFGVATGDSRPLAQRAAKRLIEIVKLFCRAHGCTATIDGIAADYRHPLMDDGFYWRCHVRIEAR